MTPAQQADAELVAAHFSYSVEALQFEVDRRRFGSFTRTLAGSPAERDRYQRALAVAQSKEQS
jgi:hypothetical protein